MAGWSLGEHQEWSKFSNFEVSTRVPFLISLPNLMPINEDTNFSSLKRESSNNKVFNRPVELLDLFPTLVDLAGLPKIEVCPSNSTNIQLCTEGNSLSPIIKTFKFYDRANIPNRKFQFKSYLAFLNKFKKKKLLKITNKVAYSQYPRPSIVPSKTPDSDQPRLTETNIMGYSMRTSRYRYTVWLPFDHETFKSNWSNIVAQELYDHKIDPEENFNVVFKKSYKSVNTLLRNKIKFFHNK